MTCPIPTPIICLILALAVSGPACARPPGDPGPLSGALTALDAAAVLVPREEWRPFPRAVDRGPWEALDETSRRALIEEGERWLGYSWPSVLAVRWLDFVRDGDRSRFEKIRDERRSALRSLVIAEAAEGHGRFLDDIANGLWSVCEESWWGNNAHTDMQLAGPGLPDLGEPIVELQVGEAAALLAWSWYLHQDALDRISPRLGERVARECTARLLQPARARDFGWKGYGPFRVTNWNPWIGFNWLCTSLLLERDPRLRAADFVRIMKVLDNYMHFQPDDGGCEEGPNYWGHAAGNIFNALEIAHSATRGARDHFPKPVIAEMGRFVMRLHVADDLYFNFSDASPRTRVQGALLARWGHRVGDENLARFGLARSSTGQAGAPWGSGGIYRQLASLWLQPKRDQHPNPGAVIYPAVAWLPQTGVWIGRETQKEGIGWFVGVKAGHNGEAHNHNDVGHISLYCDGQPVVVDAGREAYVAETFSELRYDRIWYTASDWHNVPFIAGYPQGVGEAFAASECTSEVRNGAGRFSVDLAGAYPSTAGLRRWQRTVDLERGKGVSIVESFSFSSPPPELGVGYLCVGTVSQVRPGRLLIRSSGVCHIFLDYQPEHLEWSCEPSPSTDRRLLEAWGCNPMRIRLSTKRAPLEGEWKVHFSKAEELRDQRESTP